MIPFKLSTILTKRNMKRKEFKVSEMSSCFVYEINRGVRRNLDSLAFVWEERKLGEVGTTYTGLS